MQTSNRTCKQCGKPLLGRADKQFCSIRCKNSYHIELRKNTDKAVVNINKILHRNRSILHELMRERKSQIKINRRILDNKKFNYKYHTHFHVNSKGKTYYYVYDYAWMSFSDDEILIRKVNRSGL